MESGSFGSTRIGPWANWVWVGLARLAHFLFFILIFMPKI